MAFVIRLYLFICFLSFLQVNVHSKCLLNTSGGLSKICFYCGFRPIVHNFRHSSPSWPTVSVQKQPRYSWCATSAIDRRVSAIFQWRIIIIKKFEIRMRNVIITQEKHAINQLNNSADLFTPLYQCNRFSGTQYRTSFPAGHSFMGQPFVGYSGSWGIYFPYLYMYIVYRGGPIQ
jgi:hypothetical protein